MPTCRTAICALLSMLVVLALAACGGDRLSKREYEQRVRSEYADVQQAFRATSGAQGEELAARIEDAQQELRDAADALDGVEPPDEVRKENEEVVEGMRRYADDLEELREAAERGDQQAIDAFNDRLAENDAVEQIAEAAEEMKFKGYDLGPIGEE
jgi:hypothetical protein